MPEETLSFKNLSEEQVAKLNASLAKVNAKLNQAREIVTNGKHDEPEVSLSVEEVDQLFKEQLKDKEQKREEAKTSNFGQTVRLTGAPYTNEQIAISQSAYPNFEKADENVKQIENAQHDFNKIKKEVLAQNDQKKSELNKKPESEELQKKRAEIHDKKEKIAKHEEARDEVEKQRKEVASQKDTAAYGMRAPAATSSSPGAGWFNMLILAIIGPNAFWAKIYNKLDIKEQKKEIERGRIDEQIKGLSDELAQLKAEKKELQKAEANFAPHTDKADAEANFKPHTDGDAPAPTSASAPTPTPTAADNTETDEFKFSVGSNVKQNQFVMTDEILAKVREVAPNAELQSSGDNVLLNLGTGDLTVQQQVNEVLSNAGLSISNAEPIDLSKGRSNTDDNNPLVGNTPFLKAAVAGNPHLFEIKPTEQQQPDPNRGPKVGS